ncbi:MAG: tetratricopeptide repeat protein, partial [Bacteroidales bacterium]|nr:tetratricopeptide repeat protein [Bacteroidales bacterium]
DGKHAGLLSIVDEYGSTKSGKLASYYLGNIYLQKGEWQKAIDYLSDFNTDDVFMQSQTKALIGDAYAELNQLDKALSYYKEALKAENDLSTPFVLIKMGQVYEMQKNYKEALECYKNIKQNYTSSMEYREVEKYMSRVEALLQ